MARTRKSMHAFLERINISPLPTPSIHPTVLEPDSQGQFLISCPSWPSTSKSNSPHHSPFPASGSNPLLPSPPH